MIGSLIAFEGIDGAGKTSIRAAVAAGALERGVDVVECGELESPLASTIREGLQTGMTPFLKTFFFAADRAWTYERVCLPALTAGRLVLWDRYVDSARVYRRVELAGTRSPGDLNLVEVINAPFGAPLITILLDISIEASLLRIERAGRTTPYSPQFLASARQEYLRLARTRPDYRIVDAGLPLDEVARSCVQLIFAELHR